MKLLDFGLAKVFEPTEILTGEGTRSGAILGTAAYMAPEQAQGKPVDRRADIWAVGAVLYEMLSGKPPFAGESSVELLAAVIRDEPNFDALPIRFRYLVGRCLRKDPHERWQSIGDLRIAIQEAAMAPEVKSARRQRLFVIGLAFALLAGVAVIGFRAWQHASPSRPPVAVPITSGVGWP